MEDTLSSPFEIMTAVCLQVTDQHSLFFELVTFVTSRFRCLLRRALLESLQVMFLFVVLFNVFLCVSCVYVKIWR